MKFLHGKDNSDNIADNAELDAYVADDSVSSEDDNRPVAASSSDKISVDMSKLKKKELLEIMLKQGEEIDALRAQVAELQDELDRREININRVGSLAEASLALTKVFEEADKAAMTYLSNLKRIAEGGMKR